MKKERKDIRELEDAYEYVEMYVINALNRNYLYNETVPENLLKQVQKELEFIKETKTDAIFRQTRTPPAERLCPQKKST